MDTRRLQLLLSLSRLGSMRAVAESHQLTTSTVSQQIAALSRDTGAPLIEPDGRRVRLTPAGRRLADHAVTILAAVDAARLDLDPDSDPTGTVRVGGFATGLRVSLLPVLADLTERYSGLDIVISEYEPLEAFALLTDDDLDLALTYDYNLAPAAPGQVLESVPLWTIRWGLGVPTPAAPDTAADVGDYAGATWIVNSRNTADEDAVRTLAAMAGFTPRIAHQIDSLDLVEDLIVAGYGVGLLPMDRPTRSGVSVLPLETGDPVLTAYAVTRKGRSTWPPLRAVLDRLRPASAAELPRSPWPRPVPQRPSTAAGGRPRSIESNPREEERTAMADRDDTEFNARNITEFRSNEGKLGGQFEGAPVLLLTTIGAKSGRSRTTPMMYLPDGDRMIVFASNAGADRNPAWYHNLRARPSAMVEVGTEKVHVRTVEISGAEHDRLYAEQARRYPGFAEYQAKTDRVIPVIALTRSGE